MSQWDCEEPSVFDEKLVTARREHRCSECRHPIVRGERYWRISGYWDGSWSHFKDCQCCHSTRCALSAELDFGQCVAYGNLADELAEYELEHGPLMPIVEVA